MWPFTKPCDAKSLQDRLQQLDEALAELGDQVDHLTRANRELDAEMASLWDKVSHALSRLGGRNKRANKEPEPEPERPQLTENPLARRLLGRY